MYSIKERLFSEKRVKLGHNMFLGSAVLVYPCEAIHSSKGGVTYAESSASKQMYQDESDKSRG